MPVVKLMSCSFDQHSSQDPKNQQNKLKFSSIFGLTDFIISSIQRKIWCILTWLEENVDRMTILSISVLFRDHLYEIISIISERGFFVIFLTNLPQTTMLFLRQFFTKAVIND